MCDESNSCRVGLTFVDFYYADVLHEFSACSEILVFEYRTDKCICSCSCNFKISVLAVIILV